MTDPTLFDALCRALARNRLDPATPDTDIESALRRAFGHTDQPDMTTTPGATSPAQSLTHQDHQLAARLGADIHTPDH